MRTGRYLWMLGACVCIMFGLCSGALATGADAHLPDGRYEPASFSFSGGTGRVEITCDWVQVEDGRARASIVFSSPNYICVKVNGETFEGVHTGETSAFEIPVELDREFGIIGVSTAMSVAHEIEYRLSIQLSADAGQSDQAPLLNGLPPASVESPLAAELFTIFHYEGGYAIIRVAGEADCLVAPEGQPIPDDLPAGITIVQAPVQAAYLAQLQVVEALFSVEENTQALPVKFLGCADEESGLIFADPQSEPDYAVLLKEGCDLFVAQVPDADATLETLRERLNMLGIPLFVDHSGEEASALGRMEWIKVYGILLGCTDAANAQFDAAVEGLNG